jgi:hypothetical protein
MTDSNASAAPRKMFLINDQAPTRRKKQVGVSEEVSFTVADKNPDHVQKPVST